jgi:hypothetical protein
MPGKNKKQKSSIVSMSKDDLTEAFSAAVQHTSCPMGMSKDLVDAVKILPEIAPDLKKIAKHADHIIAAGQLYAEGKKSIWNIVKACIIIGIISVFIAGILEKFKGLFK